MAKPVDSEFFWREKGNGNVKRVYDAFMKSLSSGREKASFSAEGKDCPSRKTHMKSL